MLDIIWRDMKQASFIQLIQEQTKVEDIFVTIKNKQWACTDHVMHRTDEMRVTKRTEWQPRDRMDYNSIRQGELENISRGRCSEVAQKWLMMYFQKGYMVLDAQLGCYHFSLKEASMINEEASI